MSDGCYAVPTGGATRVPQQLLVVQADHVRAGTHGTDPGVYHLRQWAARFSRRRRGRWADQVVATGRASSDFWGWLYRHCRPRTRTWVLAHHCGPQLTMLGLWDQLAMREVSLTGPPSPPGEPGSAGDSGRGLWRGALVLADPPVIVAVWRRGATIRIVDAANYCDARLSVLAAAVGAELPDAPGAHWSDARRLAWCAAVVDALGRLFERWTDDWESERLGVWGSTAAQCAHAAWRARFARRPVVIDRDRPHDALARRAPSCGLCRQWWRGPVAPAGAPQPRPPKGMEIVEWPAPRGPVTVWDVRSMYPAICRRHPLPFKLDSLRASIGLWELRAKLRAFGAVASVQVQSNDNPYPYVERGVTHWATGRFWTVLAADELDHALESGHVVRVGQTAIYCQDWIGAEYVDYWWRRRVSAGLDSGSADELWAQIMLRSWWGRWGQQSARWVQDTETAPKQDWGIWPETDAGKGVTTWYRAIAGHVQRRADPGETRYSMPAISACVTAYGRALMAHYARQVPEGALLYADTDSLHVTGQGDDALVTAGCHRGDQIGSLRRQEIVSEGHYYAPKDYRIGGKVVLAGLMVGARQIGPRCWSQERWQTLSELAARDPRGQARRVVEPVARPGRGRRGADPPDGWLTPPTRTEPDDSEPPAAPPATP